MTTFQSIPPQGVFNAQQYEPVQGGSKHPIGMFPFAIKNTQIVSAENEKSGMFRVTLESPQGTIDKNYSLWFPDNPTVAEIAHKQLSALCHAVGVFQVSMANQGRELVGARGTMEVGWQKDQEPGSTKGGPNGGYVEVKKVFDAAGNEPGKAPAQNNQPQQQAGWGGQAPQNTQSPPPQQQAPMQQQPGGGWAQPQQQAPGWAPAAQGQAPAPSWATQK